MEKEGNRSPAKAPDPFGGLIRARLKRMRLVDEKGRPDMAVLGVFADIYAGIFYDDLRRLLGSAEDLPTEPTVKHLAIEKHSKLYELRARSVVMVRITFTIQRDGSILFLVPFIKRHTRNTVQALDASLNVLKQVSSGLCGIHEVPISRLLENASADSGKVPTNGTRK